MKSRISTNYLLDKNRRSCLLGLPSRVIIAIALVALVSFSVQYGFAQAETSKQTTLSGNLADDPVAQDILRKIEQTKQWIADLEQREYDRIEAQKFLEDRRTVALESLNQDLIAWEKLWEEYTPRNSFAKFVQDKPDAVQAVFWDQFDFKESKVKAGREAMKKVIAEGGSLKDARNAYLKAAETKKIELIEANAQFNVKHKLAYYSQQLLFDVQGQLVNTTETRQKLGLYYTDYRVDPQYLAANPDDEFAREALGRNDSNTQCRDGFVVVHRFHANDYACITESTAEMWVQRGMGEYVRIESTSYTKDEQFDTIQSIQQAINHKALGTKIFEINEEFQKLYDAIDLEKYQTIKKYELMFDQEQKDARNEETEMIKKHASKMSKEELSELILAIRSKYHDSLETILDEKKESLKELQKKFDEHALLIKREYDSHPLIDIVWDSDMKSYQAVLMPQR